LVLNFLHLIILYASIIKIRSGDKIRFLGSGTEYEVHELGVVEPPLTRPLGQLGPGEVGYMLAGVRDVAHARVGDTIALLDDYKSGRVSALPGYLEPKPMVFSGLYPSDPDGVPLLRDSIEKLKLNDAALSFVPEKSEAFGAGFRCGFSGLLHVGSMHIMCGSNALSLDIFFVNRWKSCKKGSRKSSTST
jgi:GTP-binding protein LepA